jgi:hypothetical protein
MGQVHKDNKGDHGALYFKPSLWIKQKFIMKIDKLQYAIKSNQ